MTLFLAPLLLLGLYYVHVLLVQMLLREYILLVTKARFLILTLLVLNFPIAVMFLVFLALGQGEGLVKWE